MLFFLLDKSYFFKCVDFQSNGGQKLTLNYAAGKVRQFLLLCGVGGLRFRIYFKLVEFVKKHFNAVYDSPKVRIPSVI